METPLKKKLVFAVAEHLLARRTDAIVNISHYENNIAQFIGIPQKLLHAIPNGIAVDDGTAPLTPRSGFNPNKINLVFIGRLDRQKGIDIVTRAASLLADTDIHFHVLGKSIVEEAEIHALNASNVTFHGWVAREEIPAYLAASDAVIMPSRWEGLPIAGLEAMRAGKPLIASDRCCFPEMIQDGWNGLLFSLTDLGQLTALLRSLDRPTLQRMGENARATFLLAYTAERQSSELLRLYRALAACASEPVSAPKALVSM